MTDSRFLRSLRDRILIFDGAMGTSIQNYDLTPADFGGLEGCNDYLVITRPDIISAIHEEFMQAGCDVLETNTFGSNPLKLGEYGIESQCYEVNLAAARLARAAADRYSTPEHPRFVAGSFGPTGMLPSSSDPSLNRITFDELVDIYYRQAKGLADGGVDAFLLETSQDMLELKAGIVGLKQFLSEWKGQPIALMAQITLIDAAGRMLLGTDIGSAMTTLLSLGVDTIGLNCSTGPTEMIGAIRYLSEFCPVPISVIPNAGIPENHGGGHAHYPLSPEELADFHHLFATQYGVSIVGGCCGTTPKHLEAVVKRLEGIKPVARQINRANFISSAMTSVDLKQNPAPLIVGERVNSQGSRRCKRLLINDDYEGILAIAREQVEGGAHALDICLALNERTDEADQMVHVVKLLSQGVEAPLIIDSTEADVMEAALKVLPGKGIINSINLEASCDRVTKMCPLAKKYGAALIALTIDEVGMAMTADRKLEIAKRIYGICTLEYGIAPGDLIFDTLTFTLATGDDQYRRSAIETIESLKLIKQHLPEALTSLGVSNVSFGLQPHARAIVNSVFLYHCVQAGLDMALVHPKEITPYFEIPEEERKLADDLVFDRTPEALSDLIAYFEKHGNQVGSTQDEKKALLAGMTVEARIHYQILHRLPDEIELALAEAMERYTPVEIINQILLGAMKEVGEKFGAGELILPFVLQSAEVMKRAVAYVEQFLEKQDSYSKGRVVLATVYGDVHDIGKNLVRTILSNNGYEVHDLGKQVPMNLILEKAEAVGADAIGLSALLVSTSKQMQFCVQELHRQQKKYPIIIGGAAINRRYGRRILYVDDTQAYGGGVFYAKDAFEGLDIMNALMGEKRDRLYQKMFAEAVAEKEGRGFGEDEETSIAIPRSVIKPLDTPPQPPFWGKKVLTHIPLDELYPLIDLDSLYRMGWGARGKKGDEFQNLIDSEFQPMLESLKAECLKGDILHPQGVYGYYPCRADGNELVVYQAEDASQEAFRWRFARQRQGEHLCIADYFSSEHLDTTAFQVVTMGDRVTELCDRLQEQHEYTRAYYLHGFAVELAEAAAEWLHRRIRAELNLPVGQGKRYSAGYPACPDLSEQAKFFALLGAAEAIGTHLTEACQIVPEQSTAAIVVPHPEAKYYAV